MTKLQQLFAALRRDEAGATAIEYGLMGALISVAAITAMGTLGNSLVNTFNYVSNQETAAQCFPGQPQCGWPGEHIMADFRRFLDRIGSDTAGAT
eukprot:gene19665-24903_t